MNGAGIARSARRTRRRAFLGAAGAALLLGACGRTHEVPRAADGAPNFAAIDSLIARLMRDHDVPGLSISVIENAKPAWSKGFGVLKIGGDPPVDDSTIYEAASLSKPLFAAAVMRLSDQGLIDLDAPLSNYVSEPFIANEPRLPLITARRVLTHTSGIPHSRDEGEPLRLQSTPGERYAYSATGFDYLQAAVTNVTKKPLADFMKEQALNPLGMTRASYNWPAGLESSIAQGHDAKGQPGKTFNEKYRTSDDAWRAAVKRLYPELSYPNAAAGLYCTAADYAKFIAAFLAPAGGESFLKPESAAEMLKPQIGAGKKVSWGLGWGILHSSQGDAFWHWGNWTGLFHHFAIGLPGEKRGVVILTNSGNGLRLCQKLIPAILGVDLRPLKGFLG